MDMKRFVGAALVGGLVMWGVGYVIWGMLFADFFAANAGSATGVGREADILWAIAIGTLSLATLITFAINWTGGATLGDGFRIGALVGFLLWFGVDFIHYGAFNLSNLTGTIVDPNLSNLTGTIVDPLLEIVRSGIGGAVIAMVLGGGGGSDGSM